MFYPNNNKYGPPEKKPYIIMIPVSAIWKWFKKRKKIRKLVEQNVFVGKVKPQMDPIQWDQV